MSEILFENKKLVRPFFNMVRMCVQLHGMRRNHNVMLIKGNKMKTLSFVALLFSSLAIADIPKHSRQEIIVHTGKMCAIAADGVINIGASGIDTVLKQSWLYSIFYSKCILTDSFSKNESKITDRIAAKAYSECVDTASKLSDSELKNGMIKQYELVGRSSEILTECLYGKGENI